MGVHNGPSPVYEPDAPPRGTEAKTGGAALGPIVFSLLFLLAVERMLEPLLLPLDKDGPTEDLVCVVVCTSDSGASSGRLGGPRMPYMELVLMDTGRCIYL
jgi:hypothetical protein